MTQPPNPGEYPQGQPGGYQPPQQGGYQPPQQPGQPQPGGYQPPQQPGQPQPGGYQPPQQPGSYQPGGYQPPQPGQPGGYQPPPASGGPDFGKQPGEGYQQPGYQQPGYPQGGVPGDTSYSVGDAFNWAWNKFTKNAGPLVLATLAYAVAFAIVGAIFGFLISSLTTTTETQSGSIYGSSYSYEVTTSNFGAGAIIVTIIAALVFFVLGGAIISAFFSGIFDIAEGREVSVGSFFKPRNLGNVILASVLVGIITYIGFLLCIIPGIIAAFLLWFTTVAVVGRGISAVDGIKTSYNLVRARLGDSILAALLSYVIILVGTVLCYVGLLVAAPLAALFQVYTFRRLSGESIAPLTP
ncbi:hypothetical protein GOEFS_019_00180 [Gordonia effusa NBRC 100432]|uniref:DUF7847 domain-containing protein n=1 Tax=Gordonia effusa NBRC 100432 TaxID=1077974 RepID=H0QWA4_9ACTN|nr:hypothetical protein [Gordonia effusa]GAB17105.1 hypothetical protein GOEFS_019_00180 [Gordonia effusa NBRC 100432]